MLFVIFANALFDEVFTTKKKKNECFLFVDANISSIASVNWASLHYLLHF